MSLIIPANTLASGGYAVDNSCRFDDGSSDGFSLSGQNGNRKTFTFSCWVKRGVFGENFLFNSRIDASNHFLIRFTGGHQLELVNRTSASNNFFVTTNRLFRDVSAWYHIVVAVDTTQSTANDRVKFYVNGVQETSFATQTMGSQNADLSLNISTATHYIGQEYTSGSNFFDGYMAETVLIDGTANAVTDFGEFDEDSGIWKPIDVSGLTFGTNGFYLDFEDSAALGDDVSGNGNDFTVNNLTAIDQTTDTPTNNFAVMNPLDNFYGNYTFSEGNCQVVSSSGDKAYVASTLAVSKGKWYFETNISAMVTDERFLIGIAPRGAVEDDHPDSTANGGINFSGFNAVINSQGSVILNNFYGNNTTRFDGWTGIIGMALDLTDGSEQITFSKDGAWVTGSGTTSTTFANALQVDISAKLNESTASGFWHLVVGEGNSSAAGTFQINFGNPIFTISSGNTDGNGYGNFEYAVPSGYLSLCTANLSESG
jgi:hypothetical protein